MIDGQVCGDCVHSCMRGIYSDGDFSFLSSNKSEVKHSAGVTIIAKGAFTSQVLYLKKGLVKIVIEGDEETQVILKLETPGNYIALHAFGNDNKYPYSVIALTDVEICYIRKESLYRIMFENEKAFSYLMHWFSQEYQSLCENVSINGSRNVLGRFSAVLQYLSSGELLKYRALDYVSRADLAQLSAVSLESVHKLIAQFKAEGVVDVVKRNVVVLNPALLDKFARQG